MYTPRIEVNVTYSLYSAYLLVITARPNIRTSIRVHAHHQIYRATTNLAILNILLFRYRAINNKLNHFTTVGAWYFLNIKFIYHSNTSASSFNSLSVTSCPLAWHWKTIYIVTVAQTTLKMSQLPNLLQ